MMEQQPTSSAQDLERNGGINPRRAHFNAGTAKNASGASFAQNLRAWWYTQRSFSRQSDFAAAVGVSLGAVQLWLAGRAYPSDPLCDKLHLITGLDCFSPDGRAAARREHEQGRGLSHAAVSKRAKRQYVTPEALARCIADPEKAFTIRGDGSIICLECGQLLKQIRDTGAGAHLKEHNVSAEQYRVGPDPAHPRYGKNRPLICNALATAKRDSISARNLRPDAGLANLRPQQKGWKAPPEFSRKQSARRRGQRNPKWSKNVPDVEFIWPWVIEGRSREYVAEIVSKYSPDGKFGAGGVWVRLKAIVGKPIKTTITSAPDISTVERTAKILQDCGADETKLKAEVAELCTQSRDEVAAKNRRGLTGVVLLLLPRLRTWLQQNDVKLSPEGVARRFLADRAWMQGRRRTTREPRKYGPPKVPAEQTIWFDIGRSVEEQISHGAILVDARKAVVGKYEYDTIVRYHRLYRNYLKRQF